MFVRPPPWRMEALVYLHHICTFGLRPLRRSATALSQEPSLVAKTSQVEIPESDFLEAWLISH